MAVEKEEIILEFKVDQSAAADDMVKLRKQITQTKEEQKELTDAYKKGVITIDEYAEETVRLETVLKKEQATYKNVTKAVQTQSNSINALTADTKKLKEERNNLDLTSQKGLKRLDELNKMIDKNDKALQKNVSLLEKQKINIGNFASALDLLVPGTANLVAQTQGLTTALSQSGKAISATGFSLKTLNAIPVLAIISGLVGIFQVLSVAAKAAADEIYRGFTFIQDQEKAIQRLSKAVDNYVDSIEAQNNLLAAVGKSELEILKNEESTNLLRQAAQKGRIDLIKQELLLLAQRQNSNAKELLSDQETFNRQFSLSKAIQDSGKSEEEYLKLKREELESTQKALILLQNQNTVLGVRLGNQRVADAEEAKREAERLAALREEARLRELVARQGGRNVPVSGIDSTNLDFNQPDADAARQLSEEEKQRTRDLLKGTADFELDLNRQILRGREKLSKDSIKLKEQEADAIKKYEQQSLDAIQQSAAAAASLFEQSSAAYQVLASIDAGINTYKAANLALATYPPPFSYLAMAATIAAGLGNVAKINGFSEGGYTGPGQKYAPAGIVHRGEVVWNQRDVAMAGGPERVNSMRPTYRPALRGYADGGIVTAPAQETNNAILTANAFRNAPPAFVSVVEFNRVAARVRVKQQATKITNRRRR
jgi:hypothetical protein